MKRIVSSGFIIALIVAVALWGSLRVNQITNEMLILLTRAENENSTAQYTVLPETINEIEAYYEKHENMLFTFVRRDLVLAPEVSFCALRAYAVPGNSEDFAAEVLRAKTQIDQLRDLFFSFI